MCNVYVMWENFVIQFATAEKRTLVTLQIFIFRIVNNLNNKLFLCGFVVNKSHLTPFRQGSLNLYVFKKGDSEIKQFSVLTVFKSMNEFCFLSYTE